MVLIKSLCISLLSHFISWVTVLDIIALKIYILRKGLLNFDGFQNSERSLVKIYILYNMVWHIVFQGNLSSNPVAIIIKPKKCHLFGMSTVFRIVKCESVKYTFFIYKNALAFDVTCHFMLICRPNYICGFSSISVQIFLKRFRRYSKFHCF